MRAIRSIATIKIGARNYINLLVAIRVSSPVRIIEAISRVWISISPVRVGDTVRIVWVR